MTKTDAQRTLAVAAEDDALLTSQVTALDNALNCIQENGRFAVCVQPMLDELRRYFVHDLLQHFRREEEGLFLAVNEFLPDRFWRLQKEHDGLRQSLRAFRTAFTLASYVAEEIRQPQLWRLIQEARMLMVQLKAHAAFESTVVRELEKAIGVSKASGDEGEPPETETTSLLVAKPGGNSP